MSRKLYFAGTFTSYGATNVGTYMRLNADGTFDPTFYTMAPASGGFSAMVYDPRGYLDLMRNNFSGTFQGQNFGFGPYRVFAGASAVSVPDFTAWQTQYALPPGQNGPADDADGDGIKNLFEYYFGSNPTSAASGAPPTITTVSTGGQNYPAITFIRSQNAVGVTLVDTPRILQQIIGAARSVALESIEIPTEARPSALSEAVSCR